MSTIRLQALAKFPASVEAGDGIVIARSGGVFTFSVDPGAGIFQLVDDDLTALADNSTNGFWVRTGAGAGAARTLSGTANEVIVSNGDGVAGAPTFSLPGALTFTGTTITGGSCGGVTSPAVVGDFSTTLAQNGTTKIEVSNPSGGAAAQAAFSLVSDTGNASIG